MLRLAGERGAKQGTAGRTDGWSRGSVTSSFEVVVEVIEVMKKMEVL